MDRVLLRRLTKKSRLQFGKYAGATIGSILNVEPMYLGWLYYNASNIDFDAEVKEALHLIDIPKPGTSPDKEREWRRAYSATFTEEEQEHGRFVKAARRKAYYKARLADAKRATTFTKGQLQAINHGHF